MEINSLCEGWVYTKNTNGTYMCLVVLPNGTEQYIDDVILSDMGGSMTDYGARSLKVLSDGKTKRTSQQIKTEGTRVIISFLGGNIVKPVIVGFLPHVENKLSLFNETIRGAQSKFQWNNSFTVGISNSGMCGISYMGSVPINTAKKLTKWEKLTIINGQEIAIDGMVVTPAKNLVNFGNKYSIGALSNGQIGVWDGNKLLERQHNDGDNSSYEDYYTMAFERGITYSVPSDYFNVKKGNCVFSMSQGQIFMSGDVIKISGSVQIGDPNGYYLSFGSKGISFGGPSPIPVIGKLPSGQQASFELFTEMYNLIKIIREFGETKVIGFAGQIPVALNPILCKKLKTLEGKLSGIKKSGPSKIGVDPMKAIGDLPAIEAPPYIKEFNSGTRQSEDLTNSALWKSEALPPPVEG